MNGGDQLTDKLKFRLQTQTSHKLHNMLANLCEDDRHGGDGVFVKLALQKSTTVLIFAHRMYLTNAILYVHVYVAGW
jgi:hypothetical protein